MDATHFNLSVCTLALDDHLADADECGLAICRGSPGPTQEQKIQLLTLFSQAHSPELFALKPSWQCVICKAPATRLVHSPASWLHLPEPQLIDWASPVCGSPACSAAKERLNVQMMRDVAPGSPGGRVCFNCQAKQGSKKCSKCRQAVYSSREGQVAHWAQHKADCRRAGGS